MTTPLAADHYLAAHLHEHEGRPTAIHNPHDKPLADLPIIYGFNNGGGPYFLHACLIAQDGTALGGHACSHEGYMRHDLGVLEGSRPDRHETFRAHYPDGYRMEFVPYAEVEEHAGLQEAFRLNDLRRPDSVDAA